MGCLGSQEGARSAVEVSADAQSLRRQWYKPKVVVSIRYVCPATTMTGDVAALAVGDSLLQPVLDVPDDHAAGPPPCRRRTPRPVADRVARRIVDDVGHVLEEELLAPRGGGVVDEGERREASLLRSGVVGARGVPRDTTAR